LKRRRTDGRAFVYGVAVAGESDGGSEDVLPTIEVILRRLELAFSGQLRGTDSILFRLQEVERDRVRVEGL
jgi:hypothetical protein